jgi:Domain of unknown function (DUF3883)
MISPDRPDLLDAGVRLLAGFARRNGARGRFVALYLGLRRMGVGLAPLGGTGYTTARDLETFLDDMFTKRHRPEPSVVLTAPFGGSGRAGGYSTRTGVVAPGNRYATNTWRNNFGIQKGIGCPAEASVITELLESHDLRMACPHMRLDEQEHYVCGITGTSYRGEEHSIWLRVNDEGYQGVDLDIRTVTDGYLNPNGNKIPIFPLISMLYCLASAEQYPPRVSVGIPDFAADFAFTLEQVQTLFDCDPASPDNEALLSVVEATPDLLHGPLPPELPFGAPLPELDSPGVINSGIGAELTVAAELSMQMWDVTYTGNRQLLGYDLLAQRDGVVLRIEVKSSVGFTTPELTESEWSAALDHGDAYVLAVVDFYGSERQETWYLRNPAAIARPTIRQVNVFRLPRASIDNLRTEVDLL